MNITNIDNYLKYLSLAAVLSFFLIHKITLVFTGIILAIFLINKDFIFTSIRKKIQIREDNRNRKEIYNVKDDIFNDNIEFINNKDYNLVEKIEELGFIPSIQKHDDNKAA